jgi:hypothetical protein
MPRLKPPLTDDERKERVARHLAAINAKDREAIRQAENEIIAAYNRENPPKAITAASITPASTAEA